jgi:7-cyano-7-deazaguanine synthase
MTLALLSGGMDSTALVAHLLQSGHNVEAISVNYGQRHDKELQRAAAIADHFGIWHKVIDLSILANDLTSALTSHDEIQVPDGHYTKETMRATVVPNRNAIMLMVAAGIAASRMHDLVATAVHAGDHFIYPDCRPEFIASASETSRLGTATFGDVEIIAPFVMVDKAEIVRLGSAANAPFELSWSCYKGGDIHCGRCGTCVERAEAFYLAGVEDPTEYADNEFWRIETGIEHE